MSTRHSKLFSFLIIVSFVLSPISGYSLPQGGAVVPGYGDATLTYNNADPTLATQLDVNQTTAKVIINYDSFSIGAPEAVIFSQPDASSIALNKVIGADPSTILGLLRANGRVFLVNPNGVVFGSTAVVDTAGLLASTLNIDNDDFFNNNSGWVFFNDASGSVSNAATILMPGGFVALLGRTVENTGMISTQLGSVVLAAGEEMTINLDPQGLMSVVISEATQDALSQSYAVNNSGNLMVQDGTIVIAAKVLNDIFDRAINTSGIVQATAVTTDNGTVELTANGDGINADGIIGGKTVSLSAQTDTISPSNPVNISISGNITSTDGDITVSASDNIAQYSGSLISSTSGNVYITANDGLGIGALGWFEQQDGASINAGSGDIEVDAAEGIYLSNLTTSGSVFLSTAHDSIVDYGDSLPDVIADTLVISSYEGIGSANALETEVSNLTAYNSGYRNINIVNEGNLNLTSAVNEAESGEVNITVNSDLTVGDVIAPMVNLTANSGSILDDNDPLTMIKTDDLTLTAVGSIAA